MGSSHVPKYAAGPRNARLARSVYSEVGHLFHCRWGLRVMQISRPRDLGPLILVVGMLLILLGVSLTVGAPQR
jgi:hypothetical protein